MKLGKTITELAAELERQSKLKRDFVAPGSALMLDSTRLSGESVLKVGDVGAFPVRKIAHEQIASKLNIPTKYYEKMLEESPALLDTNVNHWLRASNAKDKMKIRTLDGNARAVLSDRYRTLDNYELAEVALPALTEAGCQIESCEITERRMYLKATTPKLQYEVKKGDVVQAGIVISNSETGHGSLSIEPLLMRLVCTNGLIVNDARMRRHHIGRGNDMFAEAQEFFKDATMLADDKAFWLKVKDTIEHAFTTIAFQQYVEKFGATVNDKVEAGAVEVVEVAQKRLGLAEGEKRLVLTHWLQSNEMNRFGFANAVTRTAQDVDNYDRATELERLGGEIIELPKTEWNKIALN